MSDAVPGAAAPSASYQQAALDSQRQGPQRGAQHPGWQPYCECCAPCAATAAKLRRLDREAAEESAEAEGRDTDGGDAHRERHERRQHELDLGIADDRRRTAYGN